MVGARFHLLDEINRERDNLNKYAKFHQLVSELISENGGSTKDFKISGAKFTMFKVLMSSPKEIYSLSLLQLEINIIW